MFSCGTGISYHRIFVCRKAGQQQADNSWNTPDPLLEETLIPAAHVVLRESADDSAEPARAKALRGPHRRTSLD
jgi:hypothetical protein